MVFDKKGSGRIATVLFVFSFWVALSSLSSKLAWAGTALGDLAASMQPGTWATLTTSNINATLREPTGAAGIIFGFTEQLHWDPVNRRLMYLGSDHNNGPIEFYQRHVQYDEATNTWSRLTEQSWMLVPPTGVAKHGYDHCAINAALRYFYCKGSNFEFHRYHLDTATWTDLPNNNAITYNNCCVGVAYFPERHSIILASLENSNNGTIVEYRESDNAWHRFETTASLPFGPEGLLDHFAEYNPVHSIVVFGGGYDLAGNSSKKLWKVDAAGTITRLTDAPHGMWVDGSIFTVDPASGNYLVLFGTNSTGGASEFWKFDVTANGGVGAWTQLPNPPSTVFSTIYSTKTVFGVEATPVSSYGVTAFVSCEAWIDCRVNLYKHSTSTPPPPSDTTAPSAPTNLQSTVVSSSQINLFWTASTDNVGVTGYRVERCQGSGCTNFAQIATPSGTSYSNTGLSSGTTYNYRIRATDAAGNLGAYSAVVSATTPASSDNTAPSSPTNLSATAVSSFQINLSWTASTDNLGVAGYNVYRGGTQIATSNTTSYSNTGLSPSTTYSYTVSAYDAAGNTSAQSSSASAVTTSSAALTFTQKCAQSGVINCFNFDSGFPLYYAWDPYNEPACNSLGTSYGFSDSNRSGPGNTIAHQQNGVCYYPFIDTSVKHSGTGSLKLTVPSLSTQGTGGAYTEVFRRPDFPYIAPGSASGNIVYMQWYQYFDTNFINNVYRFTSGSGSWKQIIWFGNPPNGHSSSSLEITHVNGRQKGIPLMYGQQGTDDYGYQDVRGCYVNFNNTYPNDTYPEPPCIRYKANQWMEFSVRIEVRGNPNDAASRVQLWVDGQLAIDKPNAKINWGPNGEGDGIGQFLLTTFMTAKDANYSQPEAHTWFDDLIISTQPIAMSTSTVVSSAPAAPSVLVVK